jgi:hypothetical protein
MNKCPHAEYNKNLITCVLKISYTGHKKKNLLYALIYVINIYWIPNLPLMFIQIFTIINNATSFV